MIWSEANTVLSLLVLVLSCFIFVLIRANREEGKKMIEWWWVFPVFALGALFGYALCVFMES